ncbi:MAG TPA: DUF61 family protein [Candidatus Methanoperedenaceae archaeon]|nr:DUF61 family protein [Candidatus Methanoperedenaceae archaeon]
MDDLISKMVQGMNMHLAVEKKTLADLLAEKKPKVKSKSGSLHYFDRSELESIAKLVPKEHWNRLRLPMFIQMNTSFGEGAARISGAAECSLVRKLLGKKGESPEIIIHMPEIRELRRRLPGATQYGFFLR